MSGLMYLEIESVGSKQRPGPGKPWVARVVGLDSACHFVREFMRPMVDYSTSNSVGSRGITYNYLLPDGLFEVSHPVNWSRCERYFLNIKDGAATRIALKGVLQCLSEASVLTCSPQHGNESHGRSIDSTASSLASAEAKTLP